MNLRNIAMNKETILETAKKYNMDPLLVELDYQMTRVLKEFSVRWPDCVFKGGTSLFKCFGLSRRFSQDIDISFNRILTGDEKKALKASLFEIAASLDMKVKNPYSVKSKRDYNCYLLEYESLLTDESGQSTGIVKVETSIACESFPTKRCKVNCLSEDFNFDILTQSLERTFVDKTFALCDYYIKKRSERLSRHIFDLYKIYPLIMDKDEASENLKKLVYEVRKQRTLMWVCPSAKEGVDVPGILTRIVNEGYYKEDYLSFAGEYENPPLEYLEVVEVISKISQSGLFDI